jgi:hypothetical protein
MRYLKQSTINQSIFDTYELSDYTIDKVNYIISCRLICMKVDSTSGLSHEFNHYRIVNEDEIIIDPNWKDKPENFDPIDPSTWGSLSWDDIPRIKNPEKKYANLIINSDNQELAILNYLIAKGNIPLGGTII